MKNKIEKRFLTENDKRILAINAELSALKHSSDTDLAYELQIFDTECIISSWISGFQRSNYFKNFLKNFLNKKSELNKIVREAVYDSFKNIIEAEFSYKWENYWSENSNDIKDQFVGSYEFLKVLFKNINWCEYTNEEIKKIVFNKYLKRFPHLKQFGEILKESVYKTMVFEKQSFAEKLVDL